MDFYFKYKQIEGKEYADAHCMDGGILFENLRVTLRNGKVVPYNKNELIKLKKCFNSSIVGTILTALAKEDVEI